jgi:hypothetical protein
MPIAVSPTMSKRIVTATLLSLCLAAGAGVPTALAAPPVVPRASATETQPARTAAQPDRSADTARYAAAERSQPKAADFEGGATFVIIGSTTAIVLGVVLLVVLL